MKQNGNALFLILIAVALFAALSYAVTQSGRGGGNIDRETLALDAAQVVNFSNLVATAVTRLRIAGGCSETDLSFHDGRWGHTDYQHTPPGSDDCNIFNNAGGGVPFPNVDPAISTLPWEIEGGPAVFGVGSDTNGGVGNDLILYLPDVSLEMCNQINRELGLGFTAPPVDFGDFVEATPRRFDGMYIGGDGLTGSLTLGCPGAPLCGVQTACFQEGASNEYYIFYNVLIAR